MQTSRLTVEVRPGHGKIVRNILAGLAQAGALIVRELPADAEPPGAPAGASAPCDVCGTPTSADRLQTHKHVDGRICPTCHAGVEKITRSFREGALRAYEEMRSQIPRMVLDLRNGADEPTFYRGFE